MKIDLVKTVMGDNSKQRNIFAATIIAGLLFGFVSGRIWSERNTVKTIIAETKTATTTLIAKALTASTGAVAINKKETPVTVKKMETKPIVVVKSTPIKQKEKQVLSVKRSTGNTIILSGNTAGNTVSLSKASLSQDSWIVIREDVDGEFGKALGAGWFPKGLNEKITVELLRNTETGKKYYAVLYTDAGDHKFSSKVNKLVTENGETTSQVFIAK